MTTTFESDFYTVEEAAKILHVSVSTIWRWIEAERLRAYRVGPRRIRIKKEDLSSVIQPAKIRKEEMAMWDMKGKGGSVRPMSANQAPDQATAIRKVLALREKILARRGGRLLPGSSADLIKEAREERTAEL
ncbi:hypothetical protein HKBW3S42_00554 [Candidatus Hakubella thermalkaliphila]|uniref:Helix-turn-helix domain-containing protein n=1 Tax=Candidatus Hakubella thermalkaliphila TaxID=2754717 RepID=A0A6V8PJ09_9ACTN|nr:hypothetical protein HKBW3S42_00554 [Candidatus Hakubella thermalkaliphila]